MIDFKKTSARARGEQAVKQGEGIARSVYAAGAALAKKKTYGSTTIQVDQLRYRLIEEHEGYGDALRPQHRMPAHDRSLANPTANVHMAPAPPSSPAARASG